QITDLKVGANISAVFMVEGADTVEITGISDPTVSEIPANVLNDTLIEGRVVKTIGTDQVLVRGIDGTEVPVFVDPATAFVLASGTTGAFADLQVGLPISVQFDVRNQRR